MTIVASHVGPVSGLTHLHLLRESAAVRAARAQDGGHRDAAREAGAGEQYSGVDIPSGIEWPFEVAEAQFVRSR